MHAKIRIIILAGFVLLMSLSARADGVVSIEPGSCTVVEQTEFDLTVSVNDSIHDFMGYDVRLIFDPAYLEILNVTEGSVLVESGYPTFFRWLNPGCACDSLHVNGAVLGNTVDGPGPLITLRFKAIAVGTTAVAISPASDLRDGTNANITFSTAAGSVRIDKAVIVEKATWSLIKYILAED